MRILIAEDDPAFRRMLSGLVAKWGYEPVVAQDGHEAWAHLQSPDGPRLALLDWVMPGLNGPEVCRKVRSRESDGYTYIVLLTANAQPENAIEGLEAGADDFIVKPFHPHELRARLTAAKRILNLEESLARRALYDPLTGLPNRTCLAELFRQHSAAATRNSQMLGLFYIDLDHFKVVNDSLGHAAGDAMLVGVTGRLKGCIGDAGLLARVGGDEFVVLASVDSPEAAASLAARLQGALGEVINAAGHRFHSSASIGVSLYPTDARDFGSLLKNADAAMYESKRRVRNSFQLFTPDIGERSRARLNTESRLCGALHRKEFAVHYQPVYELSDMRMTGSEALIRWNDPARGLIYPGEFIPVAEETGEIAHIGKWVLEQACIQVRQWELAGGSPFRVAVNISANQFASADLVEMVAAALARTGAKAKLVELEMTETVLVRDFEKSASTVQALRKLGVTVAIDDFGTGYSSFAYLANLPIDTLKIDKSFLSGIHRNRRLMTVLEAMVALAHRLGIRVIAEGIEDGNQLAAVRAAGCDEVQGYLFGRPGPPESIQRTKSSMNQGGSLPHMDLSALGSAIQAAEVVAR